MEKEIIKKLCCWRKLIPYLLISVSLAYPLFGILKYSTLPLIEIDLADEVVLTKIFPEFMGYFKSALSLAILLAFIPPLRCIYTLLVGLCLGGLFFHLLDIKANVLAINEMGLSKEPIENLIHILPAGNDLIFSVKLAICAIAVLTVYQIYGWVMSLRRHCCKCD